MILSERQNEILKTLSDIRKQIELLDSHKTVGLISKKQYDRSLQSIEKKVIEIEAELGVVDPVNAFDFMFGDSIEKFNEMVESSLAKTAEKEEDKRNDVIFD